MSCGNWKQLLAVFSFQFSVLSGNFVISQHIGSHGQTHSREACLLILSSTALFLLSTQTSLSPQTSLFTQTSPLKFLSSPFQNPPQRSSHCPQLLTPYFTGPSSANHRHLSQLFRQKSEGIASLFFFSPIVQPTPFCLCFFPWPFLFLLFYFSILALHANCFINVSFVCCYSF